MATSYPGKNFQPYPDDERFEDWYAIDDLVIRDAIPEALRDA